MLQCCRIHFEGQKWQANQAASFFGGSIPFLTKNDHFWSMLYAKSPKLSILRPLKKVMFKIKALIGIGDSPHVYYKHVYGLLTPTLKYSHPKMIVTIMHIHIGMPESLISFTSTCITLDQIWLHLSLAQWTFCGSAGLGGRLSDLPSALCWLCGFQRPQCIQISRSQHGHLYSASYSSLCVWIYLWRIATISCIKSQWGWQRLMLLLCQCVCIYQLCIAMNIPPTPLLDL